MNTNIFLNTTELFGTVPLKTEFLIGCADTGTKNCKSIIPQNPKTQNVNDIPNIREPSKYYMCIKICLLAAVTASAHLKNCVLSILEMLKTHL